MRYVVAPTTTDRSYSVATGEWPESVTTGKITKIIAHWREVFAQARVSGRFIRLAFFRQLAAAGPCMTAAAG